MGDEKLEKILSLGEECVSVDELKKLLESGEDIIAYDGFEPSGRMHIAQGILKTANVNKLTSCGIKFILWVADWYAMLNKKLNGDLSKIRIVGEYMIEIWKAAGMNMDGVEFLWSSDEILKDPKRYWEIVFSIGTQTSLSRVMRCTQIMGRSEQDDLASSQIFYPVMQCADIFFLNASICQLGMDQRKVNMLAREYAEYNGLKKPIILSHHMLMGLGQGQSKMSKSDPDSAIFMDDSEEEVNKKLMKAYCPITFNENPILDYYKNLIFVIRSKVIIQRPEKYGGNCIYKSYAELEKAFLDKKIHPKDMKMTLAKIINELIQPVREHFTTNEYASRLLEQVKSFRITR